MSEIDVSPYVYPGVEVSLTSLDQILLAVCNRFDVNVNDVTIRSRKREIKDVRYVYMAVAYMCTRESYKSIADKVLLDHATTRHACLCYINDLTLRAKIDCFLENAVYKRFRTIEPRKTITLSTRIDHEIINTGNSETKHE